MSETTAHLALPFLMAAQAQKHVTHHVSVTLGAIVSMTPIPDMDAIITKADREMYKDKGKKKR